MKRLISTFTLIIITILTLSSCSSLPGKKEIRTLDVRNKAAVYLKEGIFQFNAGRYAQALDLFDLALQLNRSLDNEQGIVLTLNSIGKTMLALNRNEEAIEIYTKALDIAKRLNDELLIMRTKGNIAAYYIKGNEIEKAYEILEAELNKIDSVKNEESAFLAHTMSLVLRKKNEYESALTYLNRSLAYNIKNDAFKALASDYYMMASIHSLQKRYEEAFAFALDALNYDKMIEYSRGIADDLEALSLISGKLGNESDSDMYRQRSAAVLEAIANINKIENEITEIKENTGL